MTKQVRAGGPGVSIRRNSGRFDAGTECRPLWVGLQNANRRTRFLVPPVDEFFECVIGYQRSRESASQSFVVANPRRPRLAGEARNAIGRIGQFFRRGAIAILHQVGVFDGVVIKISQH